QGANPGDFNRFQALDVLNKGGRWDYAPAVYWPQDTHAKVYFYAYSPAGSVNVNAFGSKLGTNASDSATVKYTVPLTATGGKQPEDFLVAKKAQSKQLGGTTVSLDFQHALSIVKFAARNKHPEATYIVKKIELLNLANEGSLDLGLLAEKDSRDSTYWKLPPTAALNNTYEPSLPAGGIGLAPGSSSFKQLTSANEGMPVLPQEVVSADTTNGRKPDVVGGEPALRVTFEATGANGQVLIPETQQLFPFPATHRKDSFGGGKATWPAIADGEFVFQMGKRYTFNFTFGAGSIDRIEFNVNSVADWDDQPTVKAIGIRNAAELRAFKAAVEAGDYSAWVDPDNGAVNLLADIDMSGEAPFEAIGLYDMDADVKQFFDGHFKGNGHKIKSLTYTNTLISTARNVRVASLFLGLSHANVEDLHVEAATCDASASPTMASGIAIQLDSSSLRNCSFQGDLDLSGKAQFVSGIALMTTDEQSSIEGCKVLAGSVIKADAAAAGIAYFVGDITACSVDDTEIASGGHAAGIVAAATQKIVACSVTGGSILGDEAVGGITATCTDARFIACYVSVPLISDAGTPPIQGGLVGEIDASKENAFVDFIASYWDETGGLQQAIGNTNQGASQGGTATVTGTPIAFNDLLNFYGLQPEPLSAMNAALQAAGAGYEYVDPSGNGSAYPVLRKL
ncbi:MAG: fimbrillin family protein, partial [Tannerella sp.]|nr:fimbrillin family protein [Tannerella sp.]